MFRLFSIALSCCLGEVLVLTKDNFDATINEHKHVLVEFYAPWCGHCKRLEPEYEKASESLKVPLAKVDATVESELGSRFGVRGYPTLKWFVAGQQQEYNGPRESAGIIDWVNTMTSDPITTVTEAAEIEGLKPSVIFTGAEVTEKFQAAAEEHRMKAKFFFIEGSTESITIQHKMEEKITMPSSDDDVSAFISGNLLPLIGVLNRESFAAYSAGGGGLVWALYPMEGKTVEEIKTSNLGELMPIAKHTKLSNLHLIVMDTDEFKDAITNMAGVSEFPALVIQKQTGDNKNYIFPGKEIVATEVISFVDEVVAGKLKPKLKSDPVPAKNDEPVRVVVGETFIDEIYRGTADVLLEIYAPWCGHCKSLEPHYNKVAQRIKDAGLSDKIILAKFDGTTNDSPDDKITFTGFPTLYFIKAGSSTPESYSGGRTEDTIMQYLESKSTFAEDLKAGNAKSDSSNDDEEL